MKNLIVSLVLVFSLLSCEEGPTNSVDTESNDTVEVQFLVNAILDGATIDIVDGVEVFSDGAYYGVLPRDVVVVKSPVITCNLFGVPEICSMTGTKGRALGVDTGSPTDDSFQVYREAGSEYDPGDLSGMLLYSHSWYPNDSDTNANESALRGAVAAWGAEWNNARIDFCDIGNPNGTHIHCVQD